MDGKRAGQFLDLAREAEPQLTRAEADAWLDRLERERDGIHAAIEWYVANGNGDHAVALAGAIWQFWLVRGHLGEGRDLLTSALAAPHSDRSSTSRATALRGAGMLAFRQGDNDAAEALFRSSVEEARRAGDRRHLAVLSADLARVALRRSDFAAVRRHAEEGRALARELGDRAAERGPLHLLAAVARMEGDLPRARALYHESIALNREIGFLANVAVELHNLAYIELHTGNTSAARDLFRQSLEWAWPNRDMYLLPYSLADFAIVAVAEGRHARATRLLAASDALFRSTGAVPDPDDRVEIDRALERVRSNLSPDEFQRQWAAGAELGLGDAVDLALERVDAA